MRAPARTRTSRRTDPAIFREAETVEKLQHLAQIHEGDVKGMRMALLAVLKAWVTEVRGDIEKRFEIDNDGRRCAADISHFQDLLIRHIYAFGVEHIHPRVNPTSGERLAIVATGGYGRGLLAPYSDIDLLILLPYKQTAWGESLVEYMLYLLWDLGFKIGHATRTVKQCIGTAIDDHTIRTALLDARWLCGDRDLYSEFHRAFTKQVIRGRSVEFIAAKLDERHQRHQRPGMSRYLVEPNIKEGKGGLRDLHTLSWLLDYTKRDGKVRQNWATVELSRSEKATFRRCEAFLWTVRCHLHFFTRRPEERLSFDMQIPMARRMNYVDKAGMRAVERFMKLYFLVARDVGELTRIICSALELKQLKAEPVLYRLLDRIKPGKSPNPVAHFAHQHFCIEHGRLNVANRDSFARDPLNIIRLFYFAELFNVLLHPNALRLLQTSFHLIDDELRANPEANELFLDMLVSPRGVENTLRTMNEAGVLGRFVPDFGRIVCLMQFNMYHHYTVDEHLIRTIGVLGRVDAGEHANDYPLATEILKTNENKRLLYVALLLHDIAKGRDQDHSEAGRDIALQLCPRLGLSRAETDLVAWLVEHHLTMSHYAHNRDISDQKTISDFVYIVQSLERLKLLLVLTVADISGVGPGVWNNWKGELLRSLYYEAEMVLAGGHTRSGQARRVSNIEEKLAAELGGWPEEVRKAYLARHYDDYWLKTDLKHQVMHAEMVRKADAAGKPLATEVVTDKFAGITEIVVYAPEHPHFLAKLAGACAASDANIIGAQISTTRDGMALDSILVQRGFDREEDEIRRARRIVDTIGQLLSGETHLDKLMAGKKKPRGIVSAFSIDPVVNIDNTLSSSHTVIEIEALDRPGLLYEITRVLSGLNLDIASAHVSTYGEKAVDSFYVRDLIGDKISDKTRWNNIRTGLLTVLSRESGAKAGNKAPARAGS